MVDLLEKVCQMVQKMIEVVVDPRVEAGCVRGPTLGLADDGIKCDAVNVPDTTSFMMSGRKREIVCISRVSGVMTSISWNNCWE